MFLRSAVFFILPWTSKADGEDQTSVTNMLNDMIASGGDPNCVYCNGKGVIIRNPFDSYEDDTRKTVVPATFWVNDIVVPSQIYPDMEWGEDIGEAAYRASVAFVIGNNIGLLLPDIDNVQNDDWGWGVFYATDSNAADGRCRWLPESGSYDCPGAWVDQDDLSTVIQDDPSSGGAVHLGTGWYTSGNPNAGGGGGGTGVHFNGNQFVLDQENAMDGNGVGLTQDWDCQCNYELNGNWWGNWFDHWLTNRDGSKLSVDQAACWVNNIRDLVYIQNQMYASYNFETYAATYWGWNEIPWDRATLADQQNWDAVLIHLPVEICGFGGNSDSPDCLADAAKFKLESTLSKWVNSGYLVPGFDYIGNRPGSYVVFVREFYLDGVGWQRWFFCQYWASPSGTFEIIFNSWDTGDDGACYINWGSGTSEMTQV